MALDLPGSVPPLYREIYDVLCPANVTQIGRTDLVKALSVTGIVSPTLHQIIDIASENNQNLNRNGIYKTLALCALCQQGKPVSDKLLQNFSDQELPRPHIGSMSEFMQNYQQLKSNNNGTLLSTATLKETDKIKVEVVPDKKGVILKHVEYNIHSQRFKSSVGRRYNDFVSLQEVLLQRFPYRIIPSLPPKKFNAQSREFIEARRKGLKRHLNIIANHPVISEDRLNVLNTFLTYKGSDLQGKLKDMLKGMPDEFMTDDNALKAKEMVTSDTTIQYGNSRAHITSMIQSVKIIREIVNRMIDRSIQTAADMSSLGSELSAMSIETTPVSTWATGPTDSWKQLRRDFQSVSKEYDRLNEASTKLAAKEELECIDEIDYVVDVLTAYRDLGDRHQKGVLHDHQRALSRMSGIKKKQLNQQIRGADNSSSNMESRILAQENAIANMENRNYYSLYCIQAETQLIYSHLALIRSALSKLAEVEAGGLTELSKAWSDLYEKYTKPLLSRQLSAPSSPTRGGIDM